MNLILKILIAVSLGAMVTIMALNWIELHA